VPVREEQSKAQYPVESDKSHGTVHSKVVSKQNQELIDRVLHKNGLFDALDQQ
jgi:hypothetical protein